MRNEEEAVRNEEEALRNEEEALGTEDVLRSEIPIIEKISE